MALSVALNIIETFVPLFNGIIPGLKLGLANIVILISLYIYGFKDTLLLSVLRVFIVGILRTGLFSMTFFFSLFGAILSLISMSLVKKYTKLSVVGVSIVGAIFHSIGQIIIAIIFLSNINILYYLPVLLISSLVTGILVGMCSDKLISYYNKIYV